MYSLQGRGTVGEIWLPGSEGSHFRSWFFFVVLVLVLKTFNEVQK
jgi:hypothetical protein